MGFLMPKAPSMPAITPMPQPTAPTKRMAAEADAAKRDLMDRMKKAEMSRQKSVLKMPELVKPVESSRRNMLSSVLG